MKALLIAEACNPEWVSVPLEGWCHSRAIARQVDAHLVTQVRNREAILRAGLVEGQDFTAIDSEAVAGPLCRIGNMLRGGAGKGWTTMMAAAGVAYYYFEHLIWKRFGGRIAGGEFDVVHRLTPLSPTIPSLLAGRCARVGVPFVLGPLNGGVPWPRAFDASRRAEKEWLSYVRSAYKLMPGYRGTLRHAAAIICGSRYTLEQMPREVRGKCVYIEENAVEMGRFEVAGGAGPGPHPGPLPGYREREAGAGPLRVVFVGRLVPYKGADMLIEAVRPLVEAGKVVVEIVGDGPEMGKLRGMACEGIELSGWVEHTKLKERLARADVFGFPSIREFGGGAVLEAMALGVVPVVVDYGGPGELVNEACGVRVAMGSRAEIVHRFRGVIGGLCEDRGRLRGMSEAGVRRVRERFTWDAKARRVVGVYRRVTAGEMRPAAACRLEARTTMELAWENA